MRTHVFVSHASAWLMSPSPRACPVALETWFRRSSSQNLDSLRPHFRDRREKGPPKTRNNLAADSFNQKTRVGNSAPKQGGEASPLRSNVTYGTNHAQNLRHSIGNLLHFDETPSKTYLCYVDRKPRLSRRKRQAWRRIRLKGGLRFSGKTHLLIQHAVGPRRLRSEAGFQTARLVFLSES
jgi:hypothetical protein